MTQPITGEQIDHVVARFYARVRVHPVLGPVFNGRIAPEAWPAHEDKISRFWRNVILQERNYHGFPMRTHLQTPELKAPMFADWLGLFDEVLREELPADVAEAWSGIAHRIGKGMRIGVADRDADKDAVPSLF